VVVHEQVPSIFKRHCVDARIWVRQRGGGNGAPRAAPIARPCLDNRPVEAPRQRLQSPIAMLEDRRLDRSRIFDAVAHANAPPRPAQVGCQLEVDLPDGRLALADDLLRARSAEDGPVSQLDRLIAHRSENVFRQPPRRVPRPAAVGRRREHSPPRLRRGAHLVEEHERALVRLEEYRVPAWISFVGMLHPIGDFLDGRPAPPVMSGDPDRHIRMSFASPSEPCGHQTLRSFHNG
jgi:hypothetical protein